MVSFPSTPRLLFSALVVQLILLSFPCISFFRYPKCLISDTSALSSSASSNFVVDGAFHVHHSLTLLENDTLTVHGKFRIIGSSSLAAGNFTFGKRATLHIYALSSSVSAVPRIIVTGCASLGGSIIYHANERAEETVIVADYIQGTIGLAKVVNQNERLCVHCSLSFEKSSITVIIPPSCLFTAPVAALCGLLVLKLCIMLYLVNFW